MANDEKIIAAAEAMNRFKAASSEQRRGAIWAFPHPNDSGRPIDVTEHVVSLLDIISMSMEWGSGMYNDNDLPGFVELCDLLKVEIPEKK